MSLESEAGAKCIALLEKNRSYLGCYQQSLTSLDRKRLISQGLISFPAPRIKQKKAPSRYKNVNINSHITDETRRQIMEEYYALIDSGMRKKMACDKLKISQVSICRWKKRFPEMEKRTNTTNNA